MFLEDNAAHPVECDSNGRLVLVLNLNLLGQVWQPAADYNDFLAPFKFLKRCAKRPLLSAAGGHTLPDHSAE
jgi:hypothetical protein